MKTTEYFRMIRLREDRAWIENEWIIKARDHPEREWIQADGRIRRWAKIEEAGGKYLRVVLLPDGETVHNAFFDRDYKP